jgi:hypothetical protein
MSWGIAVLFDGQIDRLPQQSPDLCLFRKAEGLNTEF